MSTQEANRAASNKMPPLWAAAAIVLLGWNEFLTVLYNPLWLFFGLIIFLFGKVSKLGQPKGFTIHLIALRTVAS